MKNWYHFWGNSNVRLRKGMWSVTRSHQGDPRNLAMLTNPQHAGPPQSSPSHQDPPRNNQIAVTGAHLLARATETAAPTAHSPAHIGGGCPRRLHLPTAGPGGQTQPSHAAGDHGHAHPPLPGGSAPGPAACAGNQLPLNQLLCSRSRSTCSLTRTWEG